MAEKMGMPLQPPTITTHEVHAYYTGNPTP